MRKRCLAAIAAVVVLVPAAAAADPVTLGVHAATGGATASLAPSPFSGGTLTAGAVTLPGAEASITIAVSGLTANTNYLMEIIVYGAASGWNTLRAEVLDPLDGDDALDVAPYHGGVPAGYTTSNTRDGFSFAQSSGLQRSATYAGGSASVIADETTNGGDVLLFTGLAGVSSAVNVAFGLRDYDGGRYFLVRLSAEDPVATPEPGSMILIGTGLAGLIAARRRRRKIADATAI